MYIISVCSNQHIAPFEVCEFLNLYTTVTFLHPDLMCLVLIECIPYLQNICGHPSVCYNGAWNFMRQGEHHLHTKGKGEERKGEHGGCGTMMGGLSKNGMH